MKKNCSGTPENGEEKPKLFSNVKKKNSRLHFFHILHESYRQQNLDYNNDKQKISFPKNL